MPTCKNLLKVGSWLSVVSQTSPGYLLRVACIHEDPYPTIITHAMWDNVHVPLRFLVQCTSSSPNVQTGGFISLASLLYSVWLSFVAVMYQSIPHVHASISMN